MCHRHFWKEKDGRNVCEDILCPRGKRRGSGTLCKRDDAVPERLHEGREKNCPHCKRDATVEAIMKARENSSRMTEAEAQGRVEMGNDGITEREDKDKKLEKVKKRSRCSVS
jgi:hypothetical protein